MASQGKSGGYRHGVLVGPVVVTHTGTTKVYAGVCPEDGRIVSCPNYPTTGVTTTVGAVTVTNETKSTTTTFTQAIQAANIGAAPATAAELVVSAGDLISFTPDGVPAAGIVSTSVFVAQD